MYYGADSNTLRAAHILRRSMTKAEAVLWKRLKDRKIFYTKFRRQHPVNIFIVDFYCHEYRLVIEVDGDIHNDDIANQYDLSRTEVLNKFGLKVIRFTNDQILYGLDSVIKKTQREIDKRTPLQGGRGAKKTGRLRQGGKNTGEENSGQGANRMGRKVFFMAVKKTGS
jgi:very-short-patch-repair endonuclease